MSGLEPSCRDCETAREAEARSAREAARRAAREAGEQAERDRRAASPPQPAGPIELHLHFDPGAIQSTTHIDKGAVQVDVQTSPTDMNVLRDANGQVVGVRKV